MPSDGNCDSVFRYLESDYVAALRSHYASRLRLPLDVTVIILATVVGFYMWETGSKGLGLTLWALASVFAVLLIAAFTLIPILSFRRQPKF